MALKNYHPTIQKIPTRSLKFSGLCPSSFPGDALFGTTHWLWSLTAFHSQCFTHWIRERDPWNWPCTCFCCFQSWYQMCWVPVSSCPPRLSFWNKTWDFSWHCYSFLSDLSLASEIPRGYKENVETCLVCITRRKKRYLAQVSRLGPELCYWICANSTILFQAFSASRLWFALLYTTPETTPHWEIR